MQHPLINIATQAARSASKIILRFMDQLSASEINKKEDILELINKIDLLAEEEIINHIKKSYPGHSIYAEQSGHIDGDETCWLVDPLDGTINYLHGLPHFCISIAIKKGDRIEAGIVYDPIRQELFSAVRGEGAYLDQRRIRVADTKKLETALIGTGFPHRKKQHIKPYLTTFEAIFNEVSGIRRAGSPALDLAYIASGRLDGFWETSLDEWDMAAGSLLIKEAGGIITDFQGGENYLFSGNIIAGTPKIQKALEEIIADSLKE